MYARRVECGGGDGHSLERVVENLSLPVLYSGLVAATHQIWLAWEAIKLSCGYKGVINRTFAAEKTYIPNRIGSH